MAVIVNKEDDKNADLTRRISADLREKMARSSEIGNGDPDFAEDSEYLKDLKKTSKFSWVFFALFIIAVAVVIAVALNV